MRVSARRASAGDGSIGGVARVAMAGGAPCWLAHDHARKLDGDRALAIPGRKAYLSGSASAHGGRNAGELGPGR
jgi:hypothetical protein